MNLLKLSVHNKKHKNEDKKHQINSKKIAEIIADSIVIQDVKDSLDLIGNVYYQGYDFLILREEHLSPEFFQLKTKLAGEILQKFTNYQMHLSIIGDFSQYKSRSLKAFIRESNKGKQVFFGRSVQDALSLLTKIY